MKVVVLGASGMLGSMVLRVLGGDGGFDLIATVRDDRDEALVARICPGAAVRQLDAAAGSADDLDRALDGAAWAVNAIGVVKSHIHDDEASDVERAIRVNALFPHRLAAAATRAGVRVLQIATDCVYSGGRGRYIESDVHDPLDVYGKSKSLGEAASPAMIHLRCSIVGPELRTHLSLLDWFLHQPRDVSVRGFTNHRWNGITTMHFARICRAVIAGGLMPAGLQHVVPGDEVTKADLLVAFAAAFGRTDIRIDPAEAPDAVDRTLATVDDGRNRRLWAAAGYDAPPAIAHMVSELADATRGWPTTS